MVRHLITALDLFYEGLHYLEKYREEYDKNDLLNERVNTSLEDIEFELHFLEITFIKEGLYDKYCEKREELKEEIHSGDLLAAELKLQEIKNLGIDSNDLDRLRILKETKRILSK